MTLNVASLNVRGLRNSSKCAPRLLGELSNLNVNVATVQETHFTCAKDCRVLEGGFLVFSAFSSCCSTGVSQLVGHSLNVIVNLDFADDGGRLFVADVTIRNFEFQVVAVYVPNTVGKRGSFFLTVGAVHRRFETVSFSG